MDSSAFGDKGDNIYDETLAKPENVDLSDSPIDKPWYDESGDSKENIDDDLLDSQKEHHVSGDQGESEVAYNPSETNSDSGKIDVDSVENTNDTAEEQTSYIEKYGADGGRYKDMKDEGWGHNTEPPTEVHHMPANSASELPTDDGPCIVMDYEDHRETASCGNSREAQEYSAKQKS